MLRHTHKFAMSAKTIFSRSIFDHGVIINASGVRSVVVNEWGECPVKAFSLNARMTGRK